MLLLKTQPNLPILISIFVSNILRHFSHQSAYQMFWLCNKRIERYTKKFGGHYKMHWSAYQYVSYPPSYTHDDRQNTDQFKCKRYWSYPVLPQNPRIQCRFCPKVRYYFFEASYLNPKLCTTLLLICITVSISRFPYISLSLSRWLVRLCVPKCNYHHNSYLYTY